jgi:UrcA family protein
MLKRHTSDRSFIGGIAMTRTDSALRLRRVFERFTATAGAVVLTTLVLFAPDALAATMASTADGIVVKYSQEEINSDADAERLYRKVKQASRKACGLDGGFLNLGERTRAERCYDETLADVVRKIDRPQLTALHDSKTSKVG